MTTTLKANALSFVDSTIMGISGSAPAYSIAITTAVLIGTAGTFSPAALLIFAVPMLGIASAYRALSVDDASAGASYQWTSAIFGKMLGFLSGWSLLFATLFFMVSGSLPIATATLNFIAPDAIGNVVATAMLASFWFVLIAGVVLAGITVSSRVIIVMTSIQLLILSVVLVAAFAHAFRVGSVNPFDRTWLGHGLAGSSLANCALIAIYFYWGWDVTSNLGEETDGGGESAGRGGQMSIFVTIVLYVSFATSSLLLFSIEQAKGFSDNLIYNMAIEAGLGRWGGLTASVAVILSSIGTLEATMLMFSRTLFAMGRDGVMPRAFGEVHARTQAPTRATLVIVVIGLTLIWASSLMPSVETIIYSLVNALGLHVDYYFGLAGLAAAWIFRSSYRTSLRQWLLRCVFPGLSSVVLIGFGIYAVTTFDALTNLVGLGGFVLGLILYLFRKDRMGIAPPLG